MEPVSSFWWGEALGPLHRACLRSALRVGHDVRLYCYRAPRDVPRGVALLDAATILPETALLRHRETGSVALFSDRFRYALLRGGGGTWADADMYFLRPLPEGRGYLVGEQEAGVANGAVLKLPADSAVLADLNAIFEAPAAPFWLSRRARAGQAGRRRLGLASGPATMAWGTAGPHAITALLKRHGLWHVVLPAASFYPVDWREAEWLAEPGTRLADMTTADSVAVHLWSSRIAPLLRRAPAAGSFLERLLAEGAE
jgi:hypothetical protein